MTPKAEEGKEVVKTKTPTQIKVPPLLWVVGPARACAHALPCCAARRPLRGAEKAQGEPRGLDEGEGHAPGAGREAQRHGRQAGAAGASAAASAAVALTLFVFVVPPRPSPQTAEREASKAGPRPKSAAEIDTAIAALNTRIATETLSLAEEKRLVSEIATLKKSKGSLSEIATRNASISASRDEISKHRDAVTALVVRAGRAAAAAAPVGPLTAVAAPVRVQAKLKEQRPREDAIKAELDTLKEAGQGDFQKRAKRRTEVRAWAAAGPPVGAGALAGLLVLCWRGEDVGNILRHATDPAPFIGGRCREHTLP